MEVPRLRTIERIESEIKQADPDSALSKYLLRTIARRYKISGVELGHKLIVNMDELLISFKAKEEPL